MDRGLTLFIKIIPIGRKNSDPFGIDRRFIGKCRDLIV